MKNIRFLVYVAIIFLLSSGNLICISAKSHKHRKQGKAGALIVSNEKGGVSTSTTFNVLNYGAKGDGIADDTKVSICIYIYLFIYLIISPGYCCRDCEISYSSYFLDSIHAQEDLLWPYQNHAYYCINS